MSRAARFLWVCAASALLCFIALVVLTKVSLEPEGLVIFDSRLGGYSHEDARAYLQTLSDAQMAIYRTTFRWLDTLFPILLAISLWGIIWLNTKGETMRMRLLACLAPMAYLMLDLSENAAVGELLMWAGHGGQMTGPWNFEEAVKQSSVYTQGKWMCLALSLLVALWAWRFAAKDRVA